MNKVWTDDEVDFLKLNYGKIDIIEMSNILGYKKSQISQKLNKLKISNRSWTKDEDDILSQNYPTLQIGEFSSLLIGRTESSILNRSTKLKLKKLVRKEKKNKYEINHNFFSDKNYLSCYWAGFLAADGFIERLPTTRPSSVTAGATFSPREKDTPPKKRQRTLAKIQATFEY